MAESKKANPTAGGIDVFCSHTDIWEIGKLQNHPRNPNTHTPGQIDLLAKIIEARGRRLPVTVSSRSGYIVRGHARLEAAKKKGWEEVPVDVQPYDSDEEELADLVADNRIAELSDFDPDELTDILADLDVAEMDLSLTGFTARDWADMKEDLNTAGGDGGSGPEDPDLPDDLPDPDMTGTDDRAGRFLLVYTNAEEKAIWCERLGVDPDTNQVVLTVEDMDMDAEDEGDE